MQTSCGFPALRAAVSKTACREFKSYYPCHVGAKFALLRFSFCKRKSSACFLAPPPKSKRTVSICLCRCRSFFPQSTRLCGSPEAAYDFFFVSRLLLIPTKPTALGFCGSPENLFQSPAPLFLLSRLPPRSAISDCHRQSSPHKTHCVGLLREP